jgi:hypothetical protein
MPINHQPGAVMSDEEQQRTTPLAGEQLARWLRALAAEVERDPVLAARVTDIDAAPTEIPPDATIPATADIAPQPTPPQESPVDAVPPPTLKHRRRSSRYGPPTVAGRAAELGTGVPDPFAVLAASGEAELRKLLGTLRAGSLRAIIRAHKLDPDSKLPPEATEKRMITLIVTAVKRTAKIAGD